MRKIFLVLMICLICGTAYSADLYDRITDSTEDGDKIPSHTFSCALRELARGAITKASIVAYFELDATQETNLNAIITKYQELSTQAEKDDFLVKIHDVFILSESGVYTKAKAKTELGF